ncbi:hypothetical protein PWR63_19320 [Paraburkholderia sp. A2WS-5]|uniref:hypothetical protein n=1 Tax=unclassified Paraburkholderia TaxID=2615204 RepID=UPI003B7E0A8D
MPDVDWTGYVGAATGIFGAATGIFGAVTGLLGYRRANQIKSLDLRLELRKALSDAHELLSSLPTLIELADGTHKGLLALKGLGRSGNHVAWDQGVAEDRMEIDQIAPKLRSESADFSSLSAEQLEAEIIATHKIKTRLSDFVAKYSASLAADGEERKQISHQTTTIAAARMAQAQPANPAQPRR